MSTVVCSACAHQWHAPHPALAAAYDCAVEEIEVLLTCIGDGQHESFILPRLPAVVGRDSDFRALHDRAISRRHCELAFDSATGAIILTNLSENGTIVGRASNATLAVDQRATIMPGDEISLAGVWVRIDARLRSTKGVPADRPGERTLNVTVSGGIAILGLNAVGEPSASSDSSNLTSLLAGVVRAPNGAFTLIAVNRATVRVNGEAAIERALQSADIVELAGRCYSFDVERGTLDPEAPRSGPTILVRDIRVSYGEKSALQHVSCTIPGGRLTAIVGPSGSGKTTLIKVLSGRREPDGGSMSVEGATSPVENYGAWAERSLAVVPQHDVVHPELTVEQCLRFAAELCCGPSVKGTLKRHRVAKALRETGLEGKEHARVGTLSGGERKRVNVAAALVGVPEVLLLDEPQAGLDYAMEQEVVSVLRSLAGEGRTVVFVTHSLSTMDAADHVIVLRRGATGQEGATVLKEGTPASVKLGLGRWEDVLQTASRKGGRSERPLPSPRVGMASAALSRLPRVAAMTARYACIWASGPIASAAVLLGLPLLLGLLIRLAVTDTNRDNDRILFGMVAAFWLGMNQSVREIVRERETFNHEQTSALGTLGYLASKVLFFAFVGAAQGVLLAAPLKWLNVDGPHLSLRLAESDCPWTWMWGMAWMGVGVGTIVGLLFSAACLFIRTRGEAVAVLLVVLATLPQFLYSGRTIGQVAGGGDQTAPYMGFIRCRGDNPIPETMSFFTVSRYLTMPLEAASSRQPFAGRSLAFCVPILLSFAVVAMVATWLVLEGYRAWNRRRM